MATHYDIVRRGEVASTQDVANIEFARTARPTLVVADRQAKGRGRQGRTWVEPDHGMFSSYVFLCDWDPLLITLLPLCAGVAVRRAILVVANEAVDLKWPNDLLLDGRKVGGILVESSGGRVTVGCGVNLWWSDPPDFGGALFSSDPKASLADALARSWVDEFENVVGAGPRLWPRDEYRTACITLGSVVTWTDGSGLAVEIGEDGSLVVESGDGTVIVRQGDVHLSGTS